VSRPGRRALRDFPLWHVANLGARARRRGRGRVAGDDARGREEDRRGAYPVGRCLRQSGGSSQGSLRPRPSTAAILLRANGLNRVGLLTKWASRLSSTIFLGTIAPSAPCPMTTGSHAASLRSSLLELSGLEHPAQPDQDRCPAPDQGSCRASLADSFVLVP